MSKFQDLTGQRFGRLVVIERAEDYIFPSGQKQAQWLCECSCENHNKIITTSARLKSGNTKSCGCLKSEAVKENKTYRACRNVQDVYKLVFNSKCKQLEDRFCISQLLGAVIHFKQKGFDTTYYEYINGIVVYNNGDIAVHIGGANFELPKLFKRYEIEINGEWKPFGVQIND